MHFGDNLAGCFRISFTLDIQYSALCPFLMSSIAKHLFAVVKSSKIFVCSLIAVLRQTATSFCFFFESNLNGLIMLSPFQLEIAVSLPVEII